MIEFKKEHFLVFTFIISVSSHFLFGVEKYIGLNQDKKAVIKIEVNGKILEYIDIAFKDYGQRLSRFKIESRYFLFTIMEEENLISINIDFDNDLLKKEGKPRLNGGTAKYIINKKSRQIVEKMFYK